MKKFIFICLIVIPSFSVKAPENKIVEVIPETTVRLTEKLTKINHQVEYLNKLWKREN